MGVFSFSDKVQRIKLIILLLVSNNLFSQNLVPNWSFEQCSSCPTTYTQIANAIGWYPSYVDNCCSYQVEYLNACGSPGFQVPSNVWGNHSASTGVAYMAQVTMAPTVTVNYRENIYAKLISPLVSGQTYYVSMKVVSATDCINTTNNDGIRFSMHKSFLVNNIAAVHSTAVITDQVNWTTIAGCYTADSAYNYVGVGNFFDDAHTTMTSSCPGCSNVYPGYYVDDISVVLMGITGNTTVCSGDTTTLTASGGQTYLWSTGASTSSIVVSPGGTTNYSVSIINPTCTYTANITVTADSVVPLTVSGPQAICAGDATQLNASGATSYNWSPASGLSATNVANPVANPGVTTTYTVTGIIGKCNIQAKDSVVVSVTPDSSISLTISGPQTMCAGSATQLNASGATSYSWSPASGLTATNIANPVANPNVTTTYTVTGAGGLCTKPVKDSVALTIIPGGVITLGISGAQSICKGSSVTLNASGATLYSWSPASGLSAINIANPVASPGVTTTYIVTGSGGSCTKPAKDSVTITVIQDSAIDLKISGEQNICEGGSTTLNVSGASKYSWSPASGLNSTTATNPVANPLLTTTYYVIGTNECTKQAKDSITITVSACDSVYIYVPNAFTPNADGKNDLFTAKAVGIKTFEMWIFDRWGMQLYHCTDINKGWNGKVQNGLSGKVCQEDTYVWLIEVEDIYRKDHRYMGKVSIIK